VLSICPSVDDVQLLKLFATLSRPLRIRIAHSPFAKIQLFVGEIVRGKTVRVHFTYRFFAPGYALFPKRSSVAVTNCPGCLQLPHYFRSLALHFFHIEVSLALANGKVTGQWILQFHFVSQHVDLCMLIARAALSITPRSHWRMCVPFHLLNVDHPS
jgi:hypothetical protein